MVDVVNVSFKMKKQELEEFESAVRNSPYMNKSDALRALIRGFISTYWREEND